jgi:predicted anti-sigma-YlaC factor YlaD
MECMVWEEHISTLVDRELNDTDASLLFAHLGQCVRCRKFYNHLAQLRERLQEDAWQAASAHREPFIEDRTARGKKQTSTRSSRWSGPLHISRTVAAVAVLMMVLLGSLTMLLVIDRGAQVEPTRVIYVMSLPTVEVEATYLRNGTKGL